MKICTSTMSILAIVLLNFAPLAQARRHPERQPDGGLPGQNTVEGYQALNQIAMQAAGATGTENTALGYQSLLQNTSGDRNTAVGAYSLQQTQGTSGTDEGRENTAVGAYSMMQNTRGSYNTALGSHALEDNTNGYINTAVGFFSLQHNTTGVWNTAVGGYALSSNTTGTQNTAIGHQALSENNTGSSNVAIGDNALISNVAGSINVAVGGGSLGQTLGSNNIGLGSGAGVYVTTGSNNIEIGNPGTDTDNGVIRIGTAGTQTATYLAGISGATAAGGSPVYINADGQLGTLPSSQRFKRDIAPMNDVSDAILALRPVTFRYKPELDAKGIPQFGLVAEEVAKVNPDLVVRGENGEINGVRYEAVNAMLLNEFLKEHRKVEQLTEQIATLTAAVKRQGAELQRVKVRGAQDRQAKAVARR